MVERTRDVRAENEERRIARAVAIGIPVVTVMAAFTTGVWLGPAIAILALAAGALVGALSLFWASLRVLSGDAALPPELEAMDASGHAVDALSSRRKMLIRALKDLDNERDLGKLEAADHEQLSTKYRGDLKDVLRQIDAYLAPFRPKAEAAAQAYLRRHASAAPEKETASMEDVVVLPRSACSSCSTANEVDAVFCKKCGHSLGNDEGRDEAATKLPEAT